MIYQVKLSKVHTGGKETRKQKVKVTLNIMLTLNVIPLKKKIKEKGTTQFNRKEFTAVL